MQWNRILLQGLGREQRMKAAFLSGWFFLTVATLWILKPVRVASLLAHLGAVETPYVRLAGVVTIGIVVAGYSRLVDRLSRAGIVIWANVAFAIVLFGFWAALEVGGAWLGAQRPFVWAVYILVEIYSVVMIGIFWTYANDVCNEEDAERLYGIVGLGGIAGGAAGGAFVDAFTQSLGPVHLLLICSAMVVAAAALGFAAERTIAPPPRKRGREEKKGFAAATAGAREVFASRYLMWLLVVVVAYEFTATLTDFGISVIFERAYTNEALLAKMYGRLGWIVSATAFVSQIVLVPILLQKKRTALVLPPFAILIGAIGAWIAPVAVMAFVLAAADRGLNYSIQQATKESLYVPLTDEKKYKAKAFIDMFVDRAGKAGAAFVLIAIVQTVGASVRAALGVAFASMAIWAISARRLGAYFRNGRKVSGSDDVVPPQGERAPGESTEDGGHGRLPPVTGAPRAVGT